MDSCYLTGVKDDMSLITLLVSKTTLWFDVRVTWPKGPGPSRLNFLEPSSSPQLVISLHVDSVLSQNV